MRFGAGARSGRYENGDSKESRSSAIPHQARKVPQGKNGRNAPKQQPVLQGRHRYEPRQERKYTRIVHQTQLTANPNRPPGRAIDCLNNLPGEQEGHPTLIMRENCHEKSYKPYL